MKRVCSVLLVLCLMLSFTACGETAEPEESGIALPFGLKFGMTYDEFAAKLSENDLTANPLEPDSDDDGYFSNGVELPVDDPEVWDFIKSDYLKRHASGEEFDPIDDMDFYITHSTYSYCLPTLYALFNQAKELYEIFVVWNAYGGEFAAAITEDVAETYNAFFGTDGMVDDYTCEWESDQYWISLWQEDEYRLYLAIRDKTHDLEN